MPHDMLVNIFYLMMRYVHIVCTTLLVGGTLFYEMVVPIAINDLREEQQLGVFGRARWVFRRIVWWSAGLILISGAFTTIDHWDEYSRAEVGEHGQVDAQAAPRRFERSPVRPGWWWAAHASTGVIAVLIALGLTWGGRPPAHPVGWMRINLVILLIVIFLATAARKVRDLEALPEHTVQIPFVAE